MAKGGDVADDNQEYSVDEKEMSKDKDESELHEGVMKELGEHLKNGNHKEALESLKALIMACKD
jgi:hypothetical protein